MSEDKTCEALLQFLNAAEAGIAAAKRVIAEAKGVSEVPAVNEETFQILKWERQEGSRIGEFQVSNKANNIPEKWSHAFGILSKNNATIASRYHGSDYAYSYWIYQEKMYRQRLNRK